MSVGVLVVLDAKSHEILRRIIAQAAPRLDMMNLKILHSKDAMTTYAYRHLVVHHFELQTYRKAVRPKSRPLQNQQRQYVRVL